MKQTQYANEEDKKTLERIQGAAAKLQEKMRAFKKQTDEAQENANASMARFRKLAHELDEASERAEMAETAVAKARAKAKELL